MRLTQTSQDVTKIFCLILPFLIQSSMACDISNVREYNCRAEGGSLAKLTCNCLTDAEVIVKPNCIQEYSTSEIEFNDCRSVTFEAKSIDIRNLRQINLNRIQSITFAEDSISWYGDLRRDSQDERFDISVPALKVRVTDSVVSSVASHAFAGKINEITFDGVTFEEIRPLAFSNLLQTEKIVIKNSMIRSLGVYAFKKFGTEILDLNGVTADLVPSRAFSNLQVYQSFTINNCSFNTVRSDGFIIEQPTLFQVTHSNISNLNTEAFNVLSRGKVLFKNNTFGVVGDRAFDKITRKAEFFENADFIFDSNTFKSISRYSLTIQHFDVKFRNIFINEPCDCNSLDHKIKDTYYYEDIQCLKDGNYITIKNYKSSTCSVITDHYITIIISCVVAALLIGIIGALLLYYKLVYRSKKYGSKDQSNKNGNLSLIVPDGRTYRETELHVIVERTDLLTTDL
nr:unnamed protein product [Callosobruchus analis]